MNFLNVILNCSESAFVLKVMGRSGLALSIFSSRRTRNEKHSLSAPLALLRLL